MRDFLSALATSPIVKCFGVPVVVPNGMLGVSKFDYERLVDIDPALFHVLRETPGLTDEERDRCIRGESGDGCITDAPLKLAREHWVLLSVQSSGCLEQL